MTSTPTMAKTLMRQRPSEKEDQKTMIKKLTITALTALSLTAWGALPALAEEEQHIENFAFSFEGPFGKFDKEQLRRGLKVYTEVCSACHGLQYVAFRTLGDKGGPQYSEDEVREYATQFEVYDAALDDTREAKPSDKFPMSNLENAPDLSLMAKARVGFRGPYGLGINQFLKGMGGPEYIASLLTSYSGEEVEQAGSTFYENATFPGGLIAMNPPLEDGLVDYDDGFANDQRQLAQDVTAFLMWTAEPKMMARKQTGFLAIVFLTVLTVLLYLTNKRIWAPVKKAAKKA